MGKYKDIIALFRLIIIIVISAMHKLQKEKIKSQHRFLYERARFLFISILINVGKKSLWKNTFFLNKLLVRYYYVHITVLKLEVNLADGQIINYVRCSQLNNLNLILCDVDVQCTYVYCAIRILCVPVLMQKDTNFHLILFYFFQQKSQRTNGWWKKSNWRTYLSIN